MKFEMLGDRILVRVLESNKRTKSGLYIPEMAIDGTPWLKGEVLACGPGGYTSMGVLIPQQAKVGDICVFFRSSSGGEQMAFPWEDGTEALCIRHTHIISFIRDLDKASSLVGGDGKPMVMS